MDHAHYNTFYLTCPNPSLYRMLYNHGWQHRRQKWTGALHTQPYTWSFLKSPIKFTKKTTEKGLLQFVKAATVARGSGFKLLKLRNVRLDHFTSACDDRSWQVLIKKDTSAVWLNVDSCNLSGFFLQKNAKNKLCKLYLSIMLSLFALQYCKCKYVELVMVLFGVIVNLLTSSCPEHHFCFTHLYFILIFLWYHAGAF